MNLATRVRTIAAGLLLAVASSAQAIIPENGWWYVDGENGRGFNLEVQNTFLFLSSFGYDAIGNPQWLVAGDNMTSDRNWTSTLLVTSGGWCYGCPTTTPTLTPAGSVTLAFTSSQTATITINGRAFPIRRFNMWLNDSIPDAMLGEWSAVIGTSGDVFDGERMQFRSKLTDSMGAYLSGHRMGGAAGGAQMQYLSAGEWSMLIDSSTSYNRYFRFTRTGFNRIEGNYWLVPKGGTPTGPGTFFQAFRTASDSLIRFGFGPGSSKTQPDAEGLRAHFERQDQLQFERQAAAGGEPAPAEAVESFQQAVRTFRK